MEDERSVPKDEDAEEVEAHHAVPAPEEPARSALDDEDEVEAHRQVPGPSERQVPRQMPAPSERQVP